METGILLAASITAVYAQCAVAQDGDGSLNLGTIVVTAPALDSPRTIELGTGGTVSDVYFWGDTEQGNSNGGDGSITPNDFENPTPENPAICALMSQAGFPEGCTRTFVDAGPPLVNSVISNPWQFDRLSEWARNNAQLRSHFTGSLVGLRNCYADQANDPALCESDYSARIRNVCNTHAFPFQTVTIIFADPISDRELCLRGAENIDLRMSNVAFSRALAPWYEELRNIGGFPLRYQVGLEMAIGLMTWMDQYNKLLVSSREWQNCATIISAWDANGCGSSMPS